MGPDGRKSSSLSREVVREWPQRGRWSNFETQISQNEGLAKISKCLIFRLLSFSHFGILSQTASLIRKFFADESFLVSTKIAATVVLLGFVGNLIVFFFCWKKLFAESEEEEDEERKGLAGIKFLRALWHARYLSWCKCRCLKGSGGDRSTSGGGPGSDKVCNHPKCRQKMTQTAEL